MVALAIWSQLGLFFSNPRVRVGVGARVRVGAGARVRVGAGATVGALVCCESNISHMNLACRASRGACRSSPSVQGGCTPAQGREDLCGDTWGVGGVLGGGKPAHGTLTAKDTQ